MKKIRIIVLLLLIVIALLIIGRMIFILSTVKPQANVADGTPIINSIVPASGPVETVVELKGTNLAGFEGDLDAWIKNSKGEVAYLPGIGSVPRTDETIKVKIEAKLCKANNSYSGLPCDAYLNIIPGVYDIYTDPWGKVSNSVKFTVTN